MLVMIIIRMVQTFNYKQSQIMTMMTVVKLMVIHSLISVHTTHCQSARLAWVFKTYLIETTTRFGHNGHKYFMRDITKVYLVLKVKAEHSPLTIT